VTYVSHAVFLRQHSEKGYRRVLIHSQSVGQTP
jgi:hypothetical protein